MDAHRIVAEYEDGNRETVGWCDVTCTVPLLNVDRPEKSDNIRNFVSTFTIGREGEWPYATGKRKRGTHEPFDAVDPQGRKVKLHIEESMFDVALKAWKEVGAPTDGLLISVRRLPGTDVEVETTCPA